jgi:hypothetical protein
MEQLQPASLLQPLDLPGTVWTGLSMDFIEGLPHVNDKSVFFMVVDLFSKAAHFILLAHPYIAIMVSRAFFDSIILLHKTPSSSISDRDSVFTSRFWSELFSVAGVKLNMSSAFHPQSDGQSEVVNKIIVMYLHCLVGNRPRQWL